MRALNEAGRWLGVALASTFNVLDLQAVVLGGCFGPLSPWLADEVRRTLEERSLAARSGSFVVLPSAFGDGAAVRGAAALSLRRVLEAPWAVQAARARIDGTRPGVRARRGRAREGGGDRTLVECRRRGLNGRAGPSTVPAGGTGGIRRRARVKKLIVALLVSALAVGLSVGAASAGSAKSTATTADICVLLPDTKSSVRWETQDRPALVAAFKKAKVTYAINNADGDAQKQRSQADQCLANGAKVVILVSLDAGSSLRDRAGRRRDSGAKVIEYDRQVGKGSPASIYISFDGPPSASCRAGASSPG